MSISLSLIIFTGCANNRNQQTCTLQVHGPPSHVWGFTTGTALCVHGPPLESYPVLVSVSVRKFETVRTANFVPWSYRVVVLVDERVVVVVDQLEHQKLEACPSDMS